MSCRTSTKACSRRRTSRAVCFRRDKANKAAHVEGRHDTDAGRDPGDPAECDLPSEAGKRTRSIGTYLGEDADALHPYPARGQGNGGIDAVRPVARAHYFSGEVALGQFEYGVRTSQ